MTAAKPKEAAKPRVKRGHHPDAAARAYRLVADEYIRNGNNAAEAARSQGYTGWEARKRGSEIINRPEIQRYLAERARQAAERSEMKTETWARQVMSIVTSSVGDLVDETGHPLPVHELPREVQAAIASVEIGADGTAKYKFWDKNAALQTMARHLGLFEKDNRQLGEALRVKVEIVE